MLDDCASLRKGTQIRKERLWPGYPGLMITGEPTAYHVMSRTALDRYPVNDLEKDFFVEQVVILSRLYFFEVIGFCCMGNYFHILIRMRTDSGCSGDELKKRLAAFGKKTAPFPGGIAHIVFRKRRNAKIHHLFSSVHCDSAPPLENCFSITILNKKAGGKIQRLSLIMWIALFNRFLYPEFQHEKAQLPLALCSMPHATRSGISYPPYQLSYIPRSP